VVSRFIAALLAAILQCSRRRVGAEIELNRLKQMQQPAPLAFSCRASSLGKLNGQHALHTVMDAAEALCH
jgi:hypothetical protein